MGEPDESLLRAINHYQSGLERYMQRQDETKMLHNLGKLYKLPIKVSHLEKTGIGRTVNSLRKLDGEVGDAAKSLVAKWKEMVLKEEEKKTDKSSGEESQENTPQHKEKEEKHNSSHKNEDNRKKYEKKHKSRSREHNENDSKENRHKEHNKKKRSRSSSAESSEDPDKLKSDSSDENDTKTIKQEEKNHRHIKTSNKNNEELKHKSRHSSSEEESGYVSHKSKSDKHNRDDSYLKKKHKHKSSSRDKKEENSKPAEEHRSKDTKKHENSKHENSKHDKEKKKDHKQKESKDKKDEKSDKHKKSKSVKEEKPLKESKSSSSADNKKDKPVEKVKSSKSISYSAVVNGIGSESGTSFADALGMCEPPPIKKKKLSQSEKTSTSVSPMYEEKVAIPELPLPKEPLDNLEINISTLLPPITPHYRPLGLPVQDQLKKAMTDDEALSRVMMNKNQRTKVYSGNKVIWGKVPSLFDICVRILQDNIDALEYTGGVPYSILKPILEKATPNQLFMLEQYNAYLIDDSDELWKLHCQKDFRNKSRDELESWRDMYLRCVDEREAKLKALTANIKQSQDKSIPVRTTKLAYIDSVVKPPRNIARKQAKNDTANARPSPSAKLATLATKGEAAKTVVPNPGARATERSSSSNHAMKAKKAPLMAKTLSLFKNRFKR